METESDKLLDRLFTAARADHAEANPREEHFETRLMASIRERRAEHQPWYALAWRMLPAYAGVAVIIATFSATFNPAPSVDIFAGLTSSQEDTIALNYLAGE